ncbi:MAG: OmpP1/FadL family transporter [Betaproteobacteria bacterium]|jgi:long-chain fatty acid transport protein|nr:outer membrane protein transport protein [Rhodocyclaceae bacterium]MCA3133649.1 outer membrane protein transport protein [Rhodocyclaceae bacterium]MCA3142970.1 outer membrane protein transport protein [Rhodocyclaceae bacterium]MCA3144077.1 outer membrane protein transport protein [Rhodocyclaceae bacterium]MCE2898250.1 outer membrane protein transport protein [Betaproteobacteria bacterium]
MNHHLHFTRSTLGVVFALAASAGPAAAAGFFLPYQGAAAIGNALAGSAALGEDASTVFWNPAGMSRLESAQVAVAGHYVSPQPQFTNNGSTLGLLPLSGNSGAGVESFIPNVFAVLPVGAWRFGVGVSAPWGSMTQYQDTWAGRYASIKSEIKSTDINPSVSYRVSPSFSAGVGVSYQMFEAEFTRAVPFGAPTPDGRAKFGGDSRAVGFNAGLLWEISPATRLGLSYRSAIDHKLEGDQTVTTPAGATVASQSGPITAELTTPALAQLSGVQALNDRWSLLGDVMWTQWSEIQRLDIVRSTGLVSTTLPLALRDAWRLSAAVNYRLNDAWLLRAGVAWDQTPVRSPEQRVAALPDSDRTWLSVGARWQASARHRLDFAYVHVFIADTTINTTSVVSPVPLVTTTVRGSYNNSADILSAQYTFSF